LPLHAGSLRTGAGFQAMAQVNETPETILISWWAVYLDLE